MSFCSYPLQEKLRAGSGSSRWLMTDTLFSVTGAVKDTRESAATSSCRRRTPSCLTQVSFQILGTTPLSHMRNKSKQKEKERITILRRVWWYLTCEHLPLVLPTCFNKELGDSNVSDLYHLLVTAVCGFHLQKTSEDSVEQESFTLTTWIIILKLTAFPWKPPWASVVN